VTALLAWAVGFLGVRVGGVYFAMLTLAVAQIVHELVFDFGESRAATTARIRDTAGAFPRAQGTPRRCTTSAS